MLEKRCRDPRRGYGALADDGTPAAKAPDCSLLLMPRYGYLKADDPRMVRTVETICRELGRGDGLLLRYPPDFDGMDGEEHPFGICSFWAVETLARQDRLLEAEDRFDRLAGFANDLGLYGEEIAEDGTVIGNFPQAFTHVGLILAAQQIEGGTAAGGGAAHGRTAVMSATLPALATLLSQVETVLVWGFVATIALTIVMYGSQGLGLSRLSLPYLFGTAVTLRPAPRGRVRAGSLHAGRLDLRLSLRVAVRGDAHGLLVDRPRIRRAARAVPAGRVPCRRCPICIRTWPATMPGPARPAGWSRQASSASTTAAGRR